MIARCGWLLVVLLMSACAGPGQAARAAPDGQSVHHLSFGGLDRAYRLYRPAGLPAAAPLSCPNPLPTSVMHIHGTADRMIRYDGGPGIGFAHINGPPVRDVDASWRNVDQCAAPTVTTDGGVSTATAICPGTRSVVLSTVDGGGHDWPAFATSALWRFFSEHSQ
jgi:polyhydroxybutyrate depolymerase